MNCTTSAPSTYNSILTGQDPILGSGKSAINGTANIKSDGPVVLRVTNDTLETYEVMGIAKKVDTSLETFTPEFFVTSRGGEYFFVPSVSTLKILAGGGSERPAL